MKAALLPDFVVGADGRPRAGPVIVDDGVIVQVGGEAGDAARVPLPGRMLLPGFVNAHSHAFQRALRGRVETKRVGQDDDFWSWRDLMYRAANRVDDDDLAALAAWAYLDMLRAGFTSVGEFHYLHRAGGGSTSGVVAAAGARVGLRVVVLETAYARAGAGLPPRDDQRRFVFDSIDAFLAHARAARAARPSTGLAIHSVRACPREWIEALAAEAKAWRAPLHAHACEQRGELAQCRAEHGVGPIALLASCGALTERTTIVHGTHVDADDVAAIARAGAAVCICPSTERNLGDGLAPIADYVAAGVPLSIGTDQHARIDVVDELRSLEDHERLRLERRAVLVPAGGRLAHALIPAGTRAATLGLEGGDVVVGAPADLVAIAVPAVEGVDDEAAAIDAWLVGGSSRDATDVWVGGARVLADARPTRVDVDAVHAAARAVVRKIA